MCLCYSYGIEYCQKTKGGVGVFAGGGRGLYPHIINVVCTC